MDDGVVGTRFGLAVGVAQVEVYASAAARAAVLEAEQATRVAAGLAPAGAVLRPTRLAELLITPEVGRARVQAVLADVATAQAQLHALQAAAISRLAELQPAQQQLPGARADDPADPDRPDDWVADEVAVVLGISIGSASSVVTKARALVEQLPQVWTALADGLIDVRRAQVLVDALADRKLSFGGGLADDLVDTIAANGLGWIAEGIGPTPLADRIGGAIIAADPAEADRRAERRRRRQNVTSVGQGDGLASLRTDLADAADVAAEIEVIDALAATMRKNGDKRPLGQLRIAAHHQLVTRPWETLPAEVAAARWHLTMRADLADLDDLGPLLNPPQDTHTTPVEAPPAADDRAAGDPSPPGPDSAPNTAYPDPPAGAGSPDPTRPLADADPARDIDQPGDAAQLGDTVLPGGTGLARGSGVGSIGELTVPPVAVAELLARYEALLVTAPTGAAAGGEVWFEIVDTTGRLRALTSPAEARAALRRGSGLTPPPAVDRYNPSAEQVRFVKARDRHCRFPGCARPAEYVDLDHVVPYDHDNPSAGGPTCVSNLVCLCRRHHRLKTHAPGWHFAVDPDGTLHVTPPGGRTRTTRPTCLAEAAVARDPLTELLGRTPQRFRSPTPEQRAARRAAAAERAQLAADIEAELAAAADRFAADRRAAGALPDVGSPSGTDDPPPF